MMKKVRLVVEVNEEKAKFLKAYAKENKTSVSKLVEEHFLKLLTADENEILSKQKKSPEQSI